MELGTYPGGKAAGGASERIAGLFPRHTHYLEPFLGHGAVMRRKSRAEFNIGIDANPAVVQRWKSAGSSSAGFDVVQGDAIATLGNWRGFLDASWLIYLDPPYPHDCRTKKRIYGKYEMSLQDHAELLRVIQMLPCPVAISSYCNPLYLTTLCDWRRVSFPAMTRGGMREEMVWCNFIEPTEFHDPIFALNRTGWRERQRVDRKKKRWREKFRRMPLAERQVIAAALAEIGVEDVLHAEDDVQISNSDPHAIFDVRIRSSSQILTPSAACVDVPGQLPMYDGPLPALLEVANAAS